MAYLEIGERNRETYPEVPERIEFTNHDFGLRAIKALRKSTGFEYDYLSALLRGVPRMNKETGEPVYDLDEQGNPKVGDDGQPVFVMDTDEEAIVAIAWLILWDAGYKYDWNTFDLRPRGLFVQLGEGDPETAGESGKAETDTTTESDPAT